MVPLEADQSNILAGARRAEELGYDYFAVGEHVFFHGPAPNAFVALAAAAGVTERIRLLSAATILPVYPAPLAAKMAATLDQISGGRFDLGVGIGGEHPSELRACGTDPHTRGVRTDETLEVMTRLFAGEQLDFTGRFCSVEGEALDPLPVQRPRPPIWVGGRKPAAMRRCGRFGDWWFPYMVDPGQLAAGLAGARKAAVEHGRSADEIRGAYFCWAGLGRDAVTARARVLTTLQRIYHQDFAPLAERYVPTGTPDQVASRLGEYVDAGAEMILFTPGSPGDDAAEPTELFIREVAPTLVERAKGVRNAVAH